MAPALSIRQKACVLDLVRRETGITLTRDEIPRLTAALDGRQAPDSAADLTGAELARLIDAAAPGVTGFGRDAEHFRLLAAHLRERAERGAAAPRIWTAGCSTGQEAYSLAMTLIPLRPEIGADTSILATDINGASLAHGREGRYAERDLAPLPTIQRERYFRATAHGDRQAVSPLRGMIGFREHNLARTPYTWRGRFAAIFCRYVLSWFDEPLQQRVLAEFERLLEPGGLLVTGHQEETALTFDGPWRRLGAGVRRLGDLEDDIERGNPGNEATV